METKAATSTGSRRRPGRPRKDSQARVTRRRSRSGTIQLTPAFQDWAKAHELDDTIRMLTGQIARFKAERRLGTDPEKLRKRLERAERDAAMLRSALSVA